MARAEQIDLEEKRREDIEGIESPLVASSSVNVHRFAVSFLIGVVDSILERVWGFGCRPHDGSLC